MSPAPPSPKPVLIIGAGISGLTLAQACRKHDLPYLLFERDASSTARSAGWGLTLNWSLPTFRSLLPQDVLDRIPETLVNKAAVDAGDNGNFTFFVLSTGEAKWRVPASERIRVSRERLRRVMLTGLEVQWGKTVVDMRKADDGITAVFSDGTEATGSLLAGCDGANSQIRKLCHPDEYRNKQLPVRFIGAGVRYPESKIAAIRELDRFFLQGSDPETDVYLWFSFLDCPGDPHTITSDLTNASSEHDKQREPEQRGEPMYRCQIMTSWPYRPGFLGREQPTEMPGTKAQKLAWTRRLAEGFVEPFGGVVQGIGEESEVKEVLLADWLPRSTRDTVKGRECGGRVVLVGDAGHAMVMYRGEGANHAIVDVGRLMELMRPMFGHKQVDASEKADVPQGDGAWQAIVQEYESEMIERTSVAVLASRQACLDAHDYKRLDDSSSLVRRRLMRSDLEETEREMKG